MLTKRVIVATFFGVVSVILCIAGGLILAVPVDNPLLHYPNVIINRILIGFVIGISALPMKWHTHGLFMGFIVGLPFLFHDWIVGREPAILIAVCLASCIFGIMIEFFTSVVFKLPANVEESVDGIRQGV